MPCAHRRRPGQGLVLPERAELRPLAAEVSAGGGGEGEEGVAEATVRAGGAQVHQADQAGPDEGKN